MTAFWIIYFVGAFLSYMITTYQIIDAFERDGTQTSIGFTSFVFMLIQLVFTFLSWVAMVIFLIDIIERYWPTVKNWFRKLYLNIILTLKFWWIKIIDIPL